MGKFVVSTRKNGEFQFCLLANNGEIILVSEGYTAKASCLQGIDSVKKNAAHLDNYDRKTARNGQFYFNLRATNGRVIGTSERYVRAAGMEKGIESVRKNAPDAEVDHR